jgi:hypothetical protein
MQSQSLMQTARDVFSRYWSNYRDRSESRNELAYLSACDLEMLAADCGLSAGQLRDMLKRGPHAADELLQLMKELALDEADLKSIDRGAFNDMKRICAECGRKTICRKSLKKGTAVSDHPAFCNNTELLADMKSRSSAVLA